MTFDLVQKNPEKGQKRGTTYQIYDVKTGEVVQQRMPNNDLITDPKAANRILLNWQTIANDVKRYAIRPTPIAK